MKSRTAGTSTCCWFLSRDLGFWSSIHIMSLAFEMPGNEENSARLHKHNSLMSVMSTPTSITHATLIGWLQPGAYGERPSSSSIFRPHMWPIESSGLPGTCAPRTVNSELHQIAVLHLVGKVRKTSKASNYQTSKVTLRRYSFVAPLEMIHLGCFPVPLFRSPMNQDTVFGIDYKDSFTLGSSSKMWAFAGNVNPRLHKPLSCLRGGCHLSTIILSQHFNSWKGKGSFSWPSHLDLSSLDLDTEPLAVDQIRSAPNKHWTDSHSQSTATARQRPNRDVCLVSTPIKCCPITLVVTAVGALLVFLLALYVLFLIKALVKEMPIVSSWSVSVLKFSCLPLNGVPCE